MSRILENGDRRCSRCKLHLPPSQFTPDRSRKDGIAYQCIDCKRETQLLRLYGMTLGRYREMLAFQGGGCAICHEQNRDGKALAVDHDHACCPGRKSCGACVRSLLCEDCNHMLGKARDDAARLRSAANYLDNWSSR